MNSREWTPQPVEETFTKKFVATFNSAGDRFAGSTGYGSIEAHVEDGVYRCPTSRSLGRTR